MGREVRRVPKTWMHPKKEGQYIPLFGGSFDYEEEEGGGRKLEDYMPDWPDELRTHWQMYEDCTEGTPISPVMESPEELAHWLADNEASAFGSLTASYEAWLETIRRGGSVSAAFTECGLISGVELGLRRGRFEREKDG